MGRAADLGAPKAKAVHARGGVGGLLRARKRGREEGGEV